MTMTTLDDWDERIAPVLMFIELRSKFLNAEASQILSLCKQLPDAPAWETLAEHELKKLIASMENILSLLKESQAIYESKQHEIA